APSEKQWLTRSACRSRQVKLSSTMGHGSRVISVSNVVTSKTISNAKNAILTHRARRSRLLVIRGKGSQHNRVRSHGIQDFFADRSHRSCILKIYPNPSRHALLVLKSIVEMN